ncbi:MAG: GNAT family N-acetyltransferase [Proteobacteria bacterium]|nr:GNAT family N-acetyltransferase [Pseudomonadota bacterium]
MSTMVEIVGVDSSAASMLAALHADSFSRPGDETWSEKAFSDVLRMPGAFCLIAQVETERGPSPIGFSICRVSGPDCELLSVGVVPDHRQSGTAKQLIARSIDHCTRAGVNILFLEVAEDNPVAQALYASLGFNQVGRRSGYYLRLDHRRVDALTMRLNLS